MSVLIWSICFCLFHRNQPSARPSSRRRYLWTVPLWSLRSGTLLARRGIIAWLPCIIEAPPLRSSFTTSLARYSHNPHHACHIDLMNYIYWLYQYILAVKMFMHLYWSHNGKVYLLCWPCRSLFGTKRLISCFYHVSFSNNNQGVWFMKFSLWILRFAWWCRIRLQRLRSGCRNYKSKVLIFLVVSPLSCMW